MLQKYSISNLLRDCEKLVI